MTAYRWKSWFSICGLSLLALLIIAGARAQSAPGKAPSEGASATPPKLAEEEYKNIEALKGIPADQVIPSMQFISASLGVECEYCHVARAFEKDDKKPKVTARKMIGMMMTINKENFEGHREVTCYSCHRGSPDPVATPIISAEEPRREALEGAKPGEPKPVFPPADQLLDKYLSAMGGAEALQKVTSRVEKGTLTAFGSQHSPVDVYSKAPDKRLSVMHLPNVDSVTAFDGTQGWLSVPGRVHMMTAAENAAAVWATGEFWWQVPRTIQVVLEGKLPEGVTGKDVIITLCGLYNHDEALNAAVEFSGPGVASLLRWSTHDPAALITCRDRSSIRPSS